MALLSIPGSAGSRGELVPGHPKKPEPSKPGGQANSSAGVFLLELEGDVWDDVGPTPGSRGVGAKFGGPAQHMVEKSTPAVMKSWAGGPGGSGGWCLQAVLGARQSGVGVAAAGGSLVRPLEARRREIR